jgi:predicted nucleic acid-binding protein
MRLVIDASTVVAEALRQRGRDLLNRDDIDLTIAPEALAEAEHEVAKRAAIIIGRSRDQAENIESVLDEVDFVLGRLKASVRDTPPHAREEARWRIPQDPTDIPTVALALWEECGIWTIDRDFFGCGLPVWSTDVLLSYLGRVPRHRR